jgi:glucuronate isomerase
MLRAEDFRTRRILQRMNVRVVCTTDDPVDTLEHHLRIKKEKGFAVKVLPACPDKALAWIRPRRSSVGRLTGGFGRSNRHRF